MTISESLAHGREKAIMRNRQWLLITVLLLTSCTAVFAQTQGAAPDSSNPPPIRLLRNSDVVGMVQQGLKAGPIIGTILTSHCNFDVFPPVLRDLKRRGVPDTVLMAMKMAPSGPPALPDVEAKIRSLTTPVKIPVGTVVEVETARAVSSARVSVGTPITFLVTKRIFVNDVLVIDRGAVARAHVVKVKRAAGWGRPGMLAWEMDDVVAVDGTKIKIKVTGTQSGTSRSAAIAGGALATGALIFPYSSPVALIWGLKKGDEAVLRGSRIFAAVAGNETEITGLRPRPDGVVYRDRETVKASDAPPTSTSFDRSGFKFKGFRRN
jgi:hypothetical protein